MNEPSLKDSDNNITEEYRILHKVAQILQASGDLQTMLVDAMQVITNFKELKVENKAGIFLVNEEKNVLNLFTTVGEFTDEFLEREKEVPFGDCLCGRVAVSGELMKSESCFSDSRHERTFEGMTAHGHYIVPLKTDDQLIGVMFLYTNINPVWYKLSQEVLLSIGGLIADAIQKKMVEKELADYRHRLESLVDSRTKELSRLSHRIQNIREEEKSRISREVHDELGQSLTALKIDLFQLEKKLPSGSADLQERTKIMVGLVDDTIKSVQKIAMELRPPVLDAFGLCEAIAWQAGEYEKRFGLKFDLNCLRGGIDLEKDLMTVLFRIFQESVTNVVRHAEASLVAVSITHINDQLIMLITDDGKGIQEEEIKDPSSLGLIGIRERLRFWNGQVEFSGVPEKGTKVEITIPLHKK
ncbi:MAG: ATP-binding protein [Nitrospinales bacterium]